MFWLRALSLFVPAALCAQQLTFATYQGGSGDENASGVALDSSGNVYLAGTTGSTNFPSSSTAGGGFVVKLNSAGQRQAAMLLPGVAINGIAIDPSGDAVVAGTMSAGALAPSKGAYSTPNPTGFAAKLNSTLTQTLWTATFSAIGSAKNTRPPKAPATSKRRFIISSAKHRPTRPGGPAQERACIDLVAQCTL